MIDEMTCQTRETCQTAYDAIRARSLRLSPTFFLTER